MMRATALWGTLCLAAGCKDLTGSPGLPAGTPNPSSYANAAGAIGMRNAAILSFEEKIGDVIVSSGLVTDELDDAETGASTGILLQANGAVIDPHDERIMPENASTGYPEYNYLQGMRGAIAQAIGGLAAYDTAAADTAAAKILRAEMYALTGYVEILLADDFCSGVPLSTLDFGKDFTYAPSSTTAQVYQAALGKLDTALTLAQSTAGSDSVRNLAQVLQGRAELDLGQYQAAADDVTNVPPTFQYQIFFTGFSVDPTTGNNGLNGAATVSDVEGINGLPFLSNGASDPRTATVSVVTDATTGLPLYFPKKYSAALQGTGYAPLVVASGIEAQLIQAEAQLQPAANPSGPWLATLNALRINAAANTHGTIPMITATLSDPGTDTARVRLLFRERAYWLFVDGHRQGDLRRLIRQYGTVQQLPAFVGQQQVFPTGPYLAPGAGRYGTDVTIPIDASEDANPLYHGCLDRNP